MHAHWHAAGMGIADLDMAIDHHGRADKAHRSHTDIVAHCHEFEFQLRNFRVRVAVADRAQACGLLAQHHVWPEIDGAGDTGAGGAAHLPGMAASMTRLPVLGVPVQSKALDGMDSLLSIVQMPAGIPVGTLAIGKAGATNAALLAAAMLANEDAALAQRLDAWRAAQTASVAETPE